MGKIFEANAALDQAVSSYKKALETDPGYTPARLALVTVQGLQGDNKAVLVEVQKLAKEMPNNGEVQYMLGRAYMRNQDFTNALPALEKAAALSPGLADALALYAIAAFYNGKNDLAVSAYKKALDLKPDSIPWRTDYGLFLARNGNYDEGAAELKKVVGTPGYKDAAGWVNLGYVYRNSKPPKVEDSIAAYKKALELDPKEEQAALGLGWAYLTSQKYDESIAAYNRALQIEPKLAPDVYNGIAWSHFFKKDMAQALAFAAKAKEAGRPVSRPRRADRPLQEGRGRGRRGRGRCGEGLRRRQEGPRCGRCLRLDQRQPAQQEPRRPHARGARPLGLGQPGCRRHPDLDAEQRHGLGRQAGGGREPRQHGRGGEVGAALPEAVLESLQRFDRHDAARDAGEHALRGRAARVPAGRHEDPEVDLSPHPRDGRPAVGAAAVPDPVLPDPVAHALDEPRATARTVGVLPVPHGAREVARVDEVEPFGGADLRRAQQRPPHPCSPAPSSGSPGGTPSRARGWRVTR